MYTKSDQLKKNKTPKVKKLSNSELKARVQFLIDKGKCQICGSHDLDYPHHAEFGLAKKDDRTMICICVPCHIHIHTKGFPIHGKSRADTVVIGWENDKEFADGN